MSFFLVVMSLVERDQSPEPRHELAHELAHEHPPSPVCCATMASESVANERKREEKSLPSLRANSPTNTAVVGDCDAQTPSLYPLPPHAALLQQPRDREDRDQGGGGDVHADEVRRDGKGIGGVPLTQCLLSTSVSSEGGSIGDPHQGAERDLQKRPTTEAKETYIGDPHQGAESGRTDAQASVSAVGETEAKRDLEKRPTTEEKETYIGETEANIELLFQSKFGIPLVMSSEPSPRAAPPPCPRAAPDASPGHVTVATVGAVSVAVVEAEGEVAAADGQAAHAGSEAGVGAEAGEVRCDGPTAAAQMHDGADAAKDADKSKAASLTAIITPAAAPLPTQTYGPDAHVSHPPPPHPRHLHTNTLPALEPVPALAEVETRETAEDGEHRAEEASPGEAAQASPEEAAMPGLPVWVAGARDSKEGGGLGAVSPTVSPKELYLRKDTAHLHTAPTEPSSAHVASGSQHIQPQTVDNAGAQDVRDAHVPMAEGGEGRAGLEREVPTGVEATAAAEATPEATAEARRRDLEVWVAGGRSNVVTLNLSVGGDKVSGGGGGGGGRRMRPRTLILCA